MSADNGVYILETRDQYRVIYAHAIENLWYSHINSYNQELVPTRIVEYYSHCKYTRDKDLAFRIAKLIEKSNSYTEYGIKTFSTYKTWNQIVKEAKALASLEIEVIKKKNNNGKWDYDLSKLEEIINM